MEIIKLNLIPSGVNPTCHCSQYDNGRVIRIDLFDGLTPYVLQSGDTVTLNVRKPDNHIVTTTLTATQGNTYVNLVTTEQICACVGYNLCDLTITNGTTVIGTLNFIMQIERDVLADGIPSQSVIEDLDAQVAALVSEDLDDNYYTKSEVDDIASEKASASEVNDIKDFVDSISTEEPIPTTTTIEGLTWISGYVSNGILYESETYKHAKINVSQGDIIKAWGTNQVQMRFIDEMNGDTVVSALSQQNDYTTPSGVDSIVVSIASAYVDGANFKVERTTTTYNTVLDMDDVPTPNSDKPVKSDGVYRAIESGIYKIPCKIVRGNSFPLKINAYQSVKKGSKLGCSVTFSAFTSATLGMKKSDDSLDYSVTVNDTNLVYSYGSNQSVSTPHGLTIENNLQISVTQNKSGKIIILVTSNGVTFSKLWDFVNKTISSPFFDFTGTITEDATLSYSPEDINCDLWVFGDSYLTYGTARWIYYYWASDYANNALINAYAGEMSPSNIEALNTLLEFGKPKYILWASGMNDGNDYATPSTQWQECINSLVSICNEKGITPILATIPTVPSVNNEKKNAYVRSSGYQYVDFAKAVGANSSGVWFTGMLSIDNVHPSESGAKALYAQAITDCPQLCVKK